MTLDIVVASFFRNALTLSLAAGSLLLGLLLQKLICRRLHRISLAGGAGWSDVLVRSLRGVVMIWVALAGTAAAIRVAAIPASIFLPLERAVIVAAILSVTVFVARTASGLTELYLTKAAGIPSTIFRNLAVIVVGIVGFLVVLDEVGIPIAPIITALGIGGLAFALALQDSLANLFAGLNILMSKNIRRGDYIRLASGEEGMVNDITWRSTTLRALENHLVIIPNKKLAESILANYDLPEKPQALLVEVKLGYGADLERAERLLVEEARAALRQTPGGVSDFEPFVRFNDLRDFNVGATVILRVASFVDQYRVRHEYIKRVRTRFRAEGIEDPFPVIVQR
jgi:small-conductance mechanosensitive channel